MPISAIVSGAAQGAKAGITSALNVAGEAVGIGIGAAATNAQLSAGSGDDMVLAGAGVYDDPYGVAGRPTRQGQQATLVNPFLVIIPMLCCCICFVSTMSLMAVVA
jgi:hypothetical protein